MDLASICLAALFPLLIGNAVDGLIDGNYNSFILLIIIEIAYLTTASINRYVDTRVYSKILEDESVKYFEKAVGDGVEDSIIDARESLVDDLTGFLEAGLPRLVSTLIGIIVAIGYLIVHTTWITVGLAIIISVFVLKATFKWQDTIASNNEKSKDEQEKRQKVLRERTPHKYRVYLKNLLKIGIDSSDLDAKSYAVSYFMQLILIIAAVYILLSQRNFTAGLIFASITYLYQLNAEILDVPTHFIEMKSLVGTAKRLYGDEYDNCKEDYHDRV